MYCIYCDAETPNTATFCPKCGRQFPRALTTPVITCSACRAGNPNDAVFCWHCSRRLEQERIAGFVLPTPLLGVGGSGQAAAGNVPMVQGTPSQLGAGQGLSHAATIAGQG